MQKVYTIGHSNLDSEEFLALLNKNKIQTLIDIRTYPQSKCFPQYNQTQLRITLEEKQIVYHWAGRQLGGKRKPLPNSWHTALENSIRGFADYMDTELFQKAIVQLQNLTSQSDCTLMCAEKSPQNCHRSLIADYLTLIGIEVLHILPQGVTQPHVLNTLARRESADLVYDRNTTNSLF